MKAPFFSSPPARGAVGRLLLLSYHFAPSEEAGALRWQKLARYVAERGWVLDVVSLDPSRLASSDDRRLTELPPGVRVFAVAPQQLTRDRLESVVSANLRMLRAMRGADGTAASGDGGAAAGDLPDSIGAAEARGPLHSLHDLRRAYHAMSWMARDRAWAHKAAEAALAIESPLPLRAVVSCGPPHMVHAEAIGVAARLRAPAVLDFRDPWSLVERVPEPFGSTLLWRASSRAETAALREAQLIITNTEAHRQALSRRHPGQADRMLAVLNGFDEETVPTPPASAAFTLAYAGTIYLDRDPRPLLRAARQVVERQRLTPEQFLMVFLGNVKSYSGTTLEALAQEAGLAGYVQVLGVKPRREALAELARADQLVILPQDSHLAVPSKLYEYMVYPAWILALARPGSAVATTLDGTGADVVQPDDIDGIAAAIGRAVERKAAAGRPQPVSGQVPHLSRAAQSRKLLDAIAALGERQGAVSS